MKKNSLASFFGGEIVLRYAHVRVAAFLYMGLPFIIFSLTWLAFLPALISTTITLFILTLVIFPNLLKKQPTPEGAVLNRHSVEELHVPMVVMIAVMLLAGVWVWWSGIGGGFYQSGDFPYRNAVFHDLIDYKWPVIYSGKKGMLAYYIGFWLPAAVVAKAAGGILHNDDAVWQIGNSALYIWTLLGVLLVLLMLFFNVKATGGKKVLAATLIFLFFSGMDSVGWLAGGINGMFDRLVEENIHIEWWAKKISFPSGHLLQYSSFTTQLFWVFNQAVMTWLCTLTLFREQTPENFVFIGMMSLFCGPIPFYGFLVLALTQGALFLWRSRRHPKYMAFSLFSLSNVLAVLGVFPVCFAYFTGNSAATIKSGSKLLRFVPRLIFNVGGRADGGISTKRLLLFIAFLLLEFLLAALLIMWHSRKELPFWVCLGMLCFFPLIFTGAAADFCMRATIPALVVMCVYIVRFLFEKWNSPKRSVDRLICITLVLFLLFGAVTPAVEMSRGIYKSAEAGHFVTYNDTFKSLGSDKKDASSVRNFTAQNYENSKFYKYFARR